MLTFFVSVPNGRREVVSPSIAIVAVVFAAMLISTLLSTFASATLMRSNSSSRLVSMRHGIVIESHEIPSF